MIRSRLAAKRRQGRTCRFAAEGTYADFSCQPKTPSMHCEVSFRLIWSRRTGPRLGDLTPSQTRSIGRSLRALTRESDAGRT